MEIKIKETTLQDLHNIMELWNNGEVMKFVGFPNGIGISIEKLEKWLKAIDNNPLTKHFSIYSQKNEYCGETYYSIIKDHDLSALDIKLLPCAQGKGIATQALSFTLDQIFNNNLASKAYVDPSLQNQKALKLYQKLGFVEKERPMFLEPGDTYFEITKLDWKKPSF